jgi:acetoin utilization deacetylase AcuC-like enzyme
MIAYYCDHFVLPLPDGHRFPMSKYAKLRQRIIDSGTLAPQHLHVPDGATDEDLLRAHTPDYLDKVLVGTLSPKELRRMGFPWSPALVERSRRSSGGTISACRSSLSDGISANLAGGTHHACPDHGEGYCVFNDSAIAARKMQAEGRANKIVVIDCDVHQGNGTAAATQDDPSIFTFSIHGEKNFPFRKISSDMDIGLPNDTEDAGYLDILELAIDRILYLQQPDLVIYQSGADPYIHDKLGKLSLSKHGLAQRDRMVIGKCFAEKIPVAVTMGGGYAAQVDDIVDIHLQTIQIALEFHAMW